MINQEESITSNTKPITLTPQFKMDIVLNGNKYKRRVKRTPLVILNDHYGGGGRV